MLPAGLVLGGCKRDGLPTKFDLSLKKAVASESIATVEWKAMI
jgi:hypothetical protein